MTEHTIKVTHCGKCPFFHEDYSGIAHRAECWLDIDVIPTMDTIPYSCPLKKKGPVKVELKSEVKKSPV